MTTEREILALAGEPVGYQYCYQGQDICLSLKPQAAEIPASYYWQEPLYTADQVIAVVKPLEEEIERKQRVIGEQCRKLGILDNTNSELRQQLAAANAEIQKLALDCLSADGQALDNWTQLSAAQAREQQYREALEYKHDALDALMKWCVKNVNKWDFPQYDNCAYAVRKMEGALAQPQDTSALQAMISKAGEVMRERAAKKFDGQTLTSDVSERIRALPPLTLEDLPKG